MEENQRPNDDQERFLPIANINRIMKEALPKDTKISKEARECVQECVSEFIAFVTCESCEITKEEKRKTINGEDIIRSMKELNFEEYLSNIIYYNKKYKLAIKGQVVQEDLENDDEIMAPPDLPPSLQ